MLTTTPNDLSSSAPHTAKYSARLPHPFFSVVLDREPQVIELVAGILTIALIVAIRIYALCMTTAATESGWAVVIVRLLIVFTDSYLYSACLIQAANLELVSL